MNIVAAVEAAKGKAVYTLFDEETQGSHSYGITVDSELFGEPEKSTVRDITSDKAFAERLLFTLADNLVLPSTLSEIVEDYIAAAFTV